MARNGKGLVKTIKEWLFSNFEMKDMDKTSYILGLKPTRIILENF